jgi:uncharacterized membrane protein YccC
LVTGLSKINGINARQWASALLSSVLALLFGLRLWAAVCLALYIAFWFQLDNAYWAGTSAALSAGSSSFRNTPKVALMIPAPTRTTSGSPVG